VLGSREAKTAFRGKIWPKVRVTKGEMAENRGKRTESEGQNGLEGRK